MRNIWTVFSRELRSYFSSPIAYVVLTVFLLLFGLFFYPMLAGFVQWSFQIMQQAQMYRQMPPPVNINEMIIRNLLHNMAIVSIFMVPFITMRLIAEERKQGTLELLMTSPITPIQWILGKYFAGLALFIIMIIPTFLLLLLLFLYGNPEFWPIVSGYLGFILIGSTFLAIGIFVSSLTESQIIAGVVGVLLALGFWVLDWMAVSSYGMADKILSYLSMVSHFDDFSKGVINTKDIAFYLSFIVFGIFLTYRSIESIRWRM